MLVSQYEIASRLSYFLWASMPDAQLLQLAEQESLHDETVLASEVARMLSSEVDRRGLRRDSQGSRGLQPVSLNNGWERVPWDASSSPTNRLRGTTIRN